MEKVEKIEYMQKRIDFFYSENHIRAIKEHDYLYRFPNDFEKFCEDNFSIINYCFYLGEYCKKNRKWLSDYKKWYKYKSYDKHKLLHKMGHLIEALVIEVLFENGPIRLLDEICSRLEHRWDTSGPKEFWYIKNGEHYLEYAFMAGLMNVTDEEIDEFWENQTYLIEKEEEMVSEMLADMRDSYYSDDHYPEFERPVSEEDAVMRALENGNGDTIGF